VATAGVLCVTLEKLPDLVHARWGDLLQLSTCLTWTAYTLVGARAVARSGALRVTVAAMAVATALLAPLALASGLTTRAPGPWELASLVFLGVFCSALAMVLWYRSQALYGSQRTGAMLYLEPFVTLLVALLVGQEGEHAGALQLLGGSLVVAGVICTSRSR
jgi:drug/metabolite transporter (DMT)-like permease